MNLLHLKYAIEVDRTRSITKAASNLYMGQPNLSRAIRELEESIGITIFKRTSKGMVPTIQGEEFLAYARNILEQVDEIETLYKRENPDKLTFNISIPRASYITAAFTEFVSKLDLTKEIEINYKETNSLKAISNILQSNFNLAIIRYQTAFDDYFIPMLDEKHFKYETLWEFEHLAVMSTAHPLANKKSITFSDLRQYVEIAHGDPYVPSLPVTKVKKKELSDLIDKRIFIYERGSQFDLLCDVPITYVWGSPIPEKLCKRYSLVQRRCKDTNRKYKDVLIYLKNYKLTPIDELFIEELEKIKLDVSQGDYN